MIAVSMCIRQKKKVLVWRNKGLDNKVEWVDFFWFFYFFYCVYCIYCSKCLCSCTIELNKTKKQQHNSIPPSCAPFQYFIVLICQNEVKSLAYFWWNWVQKLFVLPRKTTRNLPWRLKKKSSGSDQILGSGRLRQTNFFFLGLSLNVT